MSSVDETEVTRTGVVSPVNRGEQSIQAGDLVGRFSVVAEIGSGGMGRIYEAQDPNLQRKVALKVLHEHGPDTHRQRLVREAQALARLEHPNVVTVHEVGTHQGSVFIAMELVTGGTLKDWTLENPPGEAGRQSEALRLLVDAGRGVLAAHGAGLVHRDIKPSNILIGADGRARVGDFGIVRWVREGVAEVDVTKLDPSQELYDSKTGTLTRTGASVGTPAYMAPEQFGDGEVAEAADQFSFCVTAWETLFGERPFQGLTVGELLGKIRDGKPAPVDTDAAPVVLVRALRKGLRLRPGDRHASLKLLVDELDAFATTGKPATKSIGRRLVVGAGLTALVVSAAAYQLGSNTDPCPGSEERLAEVWNPQRSKALASAEPTYAAWTELESELDQYAAQWVEAYDQACEAALVREEQSEAQMKERQACLELERERFDASLDQAEATGELSALSVRLTSQGAPSICATGFSLTFSMPDEVSDWLEAARLARSRANFSEALALLERPVHSGRALPGAELSEMYERAMALHGQGRHDESIPLLKVTFGVATEHLNSDIATRAALAVAPLLRDDDAHKWLRAGWEARDPSNPEHGRQFRLAEFLVTANLGTPGEVIAAADSILAPSSPDAEDPLFQVRVAKVLIRDDIRFETALRLLERAEKAAPVRDAYRPVGLRCHALSQRQDSRASDVCREALESGGRYSLAQNLDSVRGNLALCATERSVHCERIVALAEEVVASRNVSTARRELVAIDLSWRFVQTGEVERALVVAGDTCRANEARSGTELRSLSSCAVYARALGEAGRRVEALGEADRLSRLLQEPRRARHDLVSLHGNVGSVYTLFGLHERAFEHSQRAATLGLGTPLEESGVHRRANVNYCGDAAQLLPPDEALPICKRAAGYFDRDALGLEGGMVLSNLGVVYFNAKMYEDAAAAFEKAVGAVDVAGAPSQVSAVLRANLGESLEYQGQFDEGALNYSASFELCSSKWSTYHFAGTGLVRTLAKSGDLKRAQEVLAVLRRETPTTAMKPRAQIEEAAAVVAEVRGASRKAVQSYARAVDLYTLAGSEDDAERLCAEIEPQPKTCP